MFFPQSKYILNSYSHEISPFSFLALQFMAQLFYFINVLTIKLNMCCIKNVKDMMLNMNIKI